VRSLSGAVAGGLARLTRGLSGGGGGSGGHHHPDLPGDRATPHASLSASSVARPGLLRDRLHRTQAWFGLPPDTPWLTLAPATFSGRVLDAGREGTTLASALAAASAAAACPWPALVPVHDGRRDGLVGVGPRGLGSLDADGRRGAGGCLPPGLAAPGPRGAALLAARAGPSARGAAAALAAAADPDRGIASQTAAAAAAALAVLGGGGEGSVRGRAHGLGGSSSSRTAAVPPPSTAAFAAAAFAVSVDARVTYVLAMSPTSTTAPTPQGSPLRSAAAAAVSAAARRVGGGQAPPPPPSQPLPPTGPPPWDAAAPWRGLGGAYPDPLGGLELDVCWDGLAGPGAWGGGGGECGNADHHPSGGALASPAWASVWLVHALGPPAPGRGAGGGGRGGGGGAAAALWGGGPAVRRPLAVASPAAPPSPLTAPPSPSPAPVPPPSPPTPSSITPADGTAPAPLSALVAALLAGGAHAGAARSISDLASDAWWDARGAEGRVWPLPRPPAPGVVEAAVEAVLGCGGGGGGGGGGGACSPPPGGLLLPPSLRATLPRAAPPGSVASRWALATARLATPRAGAALWTGVVRALRFRCWEAGMAVGGTASASATSPARAHAHALPPRPDLAASLLHQKLAMLDCCIAARAAATAAAGGGGGGEGGDQSAGLARGGSGWLATLWRVAAAVPLPAGEGGEEEGEPAPPPPPPPPAPRVGGPDDVFYTADDSEEEAGEGEGEGGQAGSSSSEEEDEEEVDGEGAPASPLPPGAARPIPGTPFFAPILQRRPPVMADQVASREAAAAALAAGGSPGCAGAAAALARPLVASDASAFKAANPGRATLAAFLAWRNPREPPPPPSIAAAAVAEAKGGGGGGGGGAPTSPWAALWEAARPLPASAQRRLFDPTSDGERALHWLETLPPGLAWNELVPCAVAGAGAALGSGRGVGSAPGAVAAAGAFAAAFAAAAAPADPALPLAPTTGAALLSALAAWEGVAVAAEALAARLPGAPLTAGGCLSSAMAGRRGGVPVPPSERRAVGARVEAAAAARRGSAAVAAAPPVAPPVRFSDGSLPPGSTSGGEDEEDGGESDESSAEEEEEEEEARSAPAAAAAAAASAGLGAPAWAAAELGREWAVSCVRGGGGGGGARLFASARAGEGTRLATAVGC